MREKAAYVPFPSGWTAVFALGGNAAYRLYITKICFGVNRAHAEGREGVCFRVRVRAADTVWFLSVNGQQDLYSKAPRRLTMANPCPTCGGRGQVQRDRPRGGLFGRFRTPEKVLERCNRCNGGGTIQPKAEVGRTVSGPSEIATTRPVSPKAAASITLDAILSIPMDDEIQKQRAEYKAHWERATPEKREYM